MALSREKIKTMSESALVDALEKEKNPRKMNRIVEEMGRRGDFVSLESMLKKYSQELPVNTRLSFIKAMNEFTIVSKEFLESILGEEDITDDMMYFTFMLFVNIGEISYVIDISLADEERSKKIAQEVLDDLD